MELIDKGFPTYQIELSKIDAKIDFMTGLVYAV